MIKLGGIPNPSAYLYANLAQTHVWMIILLCTWMIALLFDDHDHSSQVVFIYLFI